MTLPHHRSSAESGPLPRSSTLSDRFESGFANGTVENSVSIDVLDIRICLRVQAVIATLRRVLVMVS